MADWNKKPNWTELENIMLEQATRKIGLTAEQFNYVMHNIQYLYNNLGLANIEIGTIKTIYTAPGTPFDVDIVHREVIYKEGMGTTVGTYEFGDTIDYLDFTFKIAVAKITTSSSAIISENEQVVSAVVTPTQLSDKSGYNFNFDFTIPRGIQGVSIRNKGEYSPTERYVNNKNYIDSVQYKGSLYCPKVAITTAGVLPTNTTQWTLMASRGERGYGITSITKVSTTGLKDNYKIIYSDNQEILFSVVNGDNIELRVANNYIQWKSVTGTTWTNLIALADLSDAVAAMQKAQEALDTRSAVKKNGILIPIFNVSETPTAGYGALYDSRKNLKSDKPFENNDCIRLVDLESLILGKGLEAPLYDSNNTLLKDSNGNVILANLKI